VIASVRARIVAVSFAWAVLTACDVTDIVAYRSLPGDCPGAACPVMDAGPDASPDTGVDAGIDTGVDTGVDAGADSGVDTGIDAGPSGPCAAATCSGALACAAPIPRAIVGDSCGAQPWVAPAFQHALCSCGDYVSELPLTIVPAVAGSATPVAVDGDLTAGARIDVAGPLFVAGELALVGDGGIDAVDVQPETGAPRCDCSPSVALTVDAVRALAPANPAGFDPAAFGNIAADVSIPLGCGAYRVPRIAGASSLNLAIEGHVVLVVEGDIALDANLQAVLAPGALLELFVLGNVRVAGAMLLGDDDDRVQLYVLGTGTIDLEADAFIAGSMYAPNAELVTRGDLTTTGSIFVRRAAPGGPVVIRYDAARASAISCDG